MMTLTNASIRLCQSLVLIYAALIASGLMMMHASVIK